MADDRLAVKTWDHVDVSAMLAFLSGAAAVGPNGQTGWCLMALFAISLVHGGAWAAATGRLALRLRDRTPVSRWIATLVAVILAILSGVLVGRAALGALAHGLGGAFWF